jgi:peptide-methionine (S)-S-oxide reductase
VLAGVWFWGIQDLIRRHDGVIQRASATLEATCERNHGTHADAIEIVLDPAKIRYRVDYRTRIIAI